MPTYVLIICTPHFAERSYAKKGGVGYEQQIVSGYLLTEQSLSKFIPILKEGEPKPWPNGSILPHLITRVYIDFREEINFERSFETLLRTIYNSPEFTRPPQGNAPIFPQRSLDIEIRIGRDFRLKGREKRAIEIVTDYILAVQAKRPVKVQVFSTFLEKKIKTYRDLLTRSVSGNLSVSERRTMLELQDELRDNGAIVGSGTTKILKDELIANEIKLLFDKFFIKRNVFCNYEEIATSVRMLIEFEVDTLQKLELTKFDVVHPNREYSFSVYVSDTEFENLLKRVQDIGLPVKDLKGFELALILHGFFSLSDFERHVTIEQAIPKIISLFFSLKMEKKEIDEDTFLNFDCWEVGLG